MNSLLHFLCVTHISHVHVLQSVGGRIYSVLMESNMCRWMYNRVLDKVLTVGRAATQGSATYNQLAQYVVSDSMFSTLICYLSFS